MNDNNGGSAFPEIKTTSTYTTDINVHSVGGMTLRDYFAAKAMQSMIGNTDKEGSSRGINGVSKFARYAYEYADAMLAERDK